MKGFLLWLSQWAGTKGSNSPAINHHGDGDIHVTIVHSRHEPIPILRDEGMHALPLGLETSCEAVPASTILPPSRFIGRKTDLSDLAAALLVPGKATALVMGGGGMGKSTLTRQAATHPDVVARFGPRRYEAKLEAATSAEEFIVVLANTVGTDPGQGLAPIVTRLGAAPTLLVLDNLETPWWADGVATEAILAELSRLPELALLASLRGRDTPRCPDWQHHHDLEPMSVGEAGELFRRIAFRIHPEDPLLEPLLAELAGIPLALELVALDAQPDDGLQRVWAAWKSIGADLTDAQRGDHRHASLARSIELSLNSLRMGEPGRRLFRLLGVLPAGLARTDQDALLGAESGPAERQLRALGLALGRDDRLDLLAPIRRHALARHPPHAEDAEGWARHLLQLTRELGQRFQARGGEVVARLRPELPNLEAALRQATVEPKLLPCATAAIWTYTLICRWTGLGGLALHSLGGACRRAGDHQGEAKCIQSLGDIALARSDHDGARERYEAALPLFRQVGSLLGEANCIRSLGDIALRRSDHDGARERYEAALPLFRQVGDVIGEANALTGLADTARDGGRIEEARSTYREVLAMEERIGAADNAAITRARLAALDK